MFTRDPYLKLVFRYFVYLGLTILALKFSRGMFGLIIVGYGMLCTFRNRAAMAMICFCLMPLLMILNPVVLNGMGRVGLISRLGIPLMAGCMMMHSMARNSPHRLPLGSLFPFVICALISSVQGYFPMISYLKLINFTLFMVGLYYGTKSLYRNPAQLEKLRAFFFAFCIFIIVGSILIRSNPQAAYLNSFGNVDADTANEIIRARIAMGMSPGYFAGITAHSQCLGPILVCVFGWALCDMLFLMKRFCWVHVFVLAMCPVFIFMTRSRTAFLALIVFSLALWGFCMPRIRVASKLRQKAVSMAFFGFVMLFIAGIAAEISNQSVTKFLRKIETDVSEDTRDLTQALTESRMGKIEQGYEEFKRSPLLGNGFQVIEEHIAEYQAGRISLYSAPIEKGFWPTMVLGETGILGFVTFMVFLLCFYSTCFRKRYVVTISLFSMYLFSNFGEANIFAPGGNGGPEWMLTVVGGFVIDLLVQNDADRRRAMQYERFF